LNKIVV